MLQIQEFERDIKKGFSHFLYLCYSLDPFFLSEITKLIRNEIPLINIESYESSELEQFDFKTRLNVKSLFTEKRVLVFHNFEKIKKSEKRVEILKKMVEYKNSSITLIILMNTSSKEISEEIAYLKKQKECAILNLDIYERNLPEWISYKASKHGITLKPDAIYYLIELTGGQPGLISSEIEKISLLTDKSTISLFDIKDILSEIGEFTPFDLLEALSKKDKKKTFLILEKLQNTEADLILGALNWYYSNKEKNSKAFPLLYKANIAIRQARSCSIELLLYELLKD